MAFHGAKLAILVKDHVVAILRDDLPGLDYANHWDLPGGAREGSETPQECVLRELKEELELSFKNSDLHWRCECTSGDGVSWFFVSKQPDFDASAVQFGDEGQCWKLVRADWFVNEARAVPNLQERLRNYLESGDACP